jgi:hypothetical protein
MLGHKNWRYTGLWIELMRGEKRRRGIRERIAYDLIGNMTNNISLIKRFAAR